MSLMEMSAVLEANHGPSVYDKMLSNPESEQHNKEDFEMVICRIAGEISVHSRMKDMNVTIIRRGGHQWVLGMEIQRTDSLFVKL